MNPGLPTIHGFDHLSRIPLYVPGKPIQEVQREMGLTRIVKLASNENPWGPTEAVKARVAAAIAGSDTEGLNLYPVSDGPYLRRAIAARKGVALECVVLGNGSSELLELVAKAAFLDGGSSIIPRHSFAIYGIATQTAGGRVIESRATATELDVDDILRSVAEDTRLVYLGHPNNPTGIRLEKSALERLVRQLREDIVLVVDQAYAEYEDPADYPDAAAYLNERPNLLVLHTFSKIHALAALRIGYGLGSRELLGCIERVRSPFNTNHLAQVAAEVAVQDLAFEAFSRQKNTDARVAFALEAAQHRCQLSGSSGNFVLLESAFPAKDLFRELLQRGVIVRPMTAYGLPSHVRVTYGKPEEMQAFWSAIGPLLNGGC
ncbi:MAG: histidinol-phosphate transaminase [Holophagaceae bacterium]|nr:histidinol-phosphate transaminase [Holophagaceae bacterium]